jgi:hypothetical protein
MSMELRLLLRSRLLIAAALIATVVTTLALLAGIAQVTHPGWISAARAPEPPADLVIAVTAVKEVDFGKFEWLVSVGAPE